MIKRQLQKIASIPATVDATAKLGRVKDGTYGVHDIPYWGQFATPELTKAILEGDMDGQDDPNWAVFGYKTKEQAAYWAARQCGIVCAKTVLQAAGDATSVADLISECVAYGGYNVGTDTGWYYKPLARLLQNHGKHAVVRPHLPVASLAAHILQGGVVIASVNPQIIRGDHPVTNHSKSGHLVLVTGVKMSNHNVGGFTIHNPSGKSDAMRVDAYIPITQFSSAYGEKGIIIV